MQGTETRRRARRGLGSATIAVGLLIGVAPAVGGLTASSNDTQPATIAATCEDAGPLTQKGSGMISGPMATALAETPVPLSLSGEAEAPTTIDPGATIDYNLDLTLDLQALAAEVLQNTIKPAIAETSPAAAATAALNLRVQDLTARLAVPTGTTVVGSPTVSTSAGGPSATAAVVNDEVVVELGPVIANAASPSSVTTTTAPGTPPFDIQLQFSVDTAAVDPGSTIDLVPSGLDFAFVGPTSALGGFNVSVSFFGSEVSGGIDGPMDCAVGETPIASTTVRVPSSGPAVADFDGDGTTDRSVFRPESGGWHVDGQDTVYLGLNGDVPVPADYDGDGATDPAVFRPSTGTWYVEGQEPVSLGLSTDVPVPADYDGDGTAELAVFRPGSGAWIIEGQEPTYFGLSTDVPVPADYDGDGTAEVAVWRDGAWHVFGGSVTYLGLAGDVPVPGDYDGSGDADQVVFRPEYGAWFGESTSFFGLASDIQLVLPHAIARTQA